MQRAWPVLLAENVKHFTGKNRIICRKESNQQQRHQHRRPSSKAHHIRRAGCVWLEGHVECSEARQGNNDISSTGPNHWQQIHQVCGNECYKKQSNFTKLTILLFTIVLQIRLVCICCIALLSLVSLKSLECLSPRIVHLPTNNKCWSIGLRQTTSHKIKLRTW